MAALHRARKVRVYLFRAIGNREFWGVVAAVTDYELFWAIDRLTNPYRVELTPAASGFAHAAQTGAGASASEFAISASGEVEIAHAMGIPSKQSTMGDR